MSEDQIDPQVMAQLGVLAHKLAWKNPDVEVLRPELADQYFVVVRALQDSIRASHRRGKLILPDLEVFGNDAIAIFSDSTGESSGKYHTYSFLTCDWHGTDHFNAGRSKVRVATGLAQKEIAFKDFRMGQMQRALAEYLRLLNSLVLGFLFTVVVA